MRAKQDRPKRRRLVWAAVTAGLVAITAVAATSFAGATPFIPALPGGDENQAADATASIGRGELEFPVLYAAVGTSGLKCPVTSSACKTTPEQFTLTKRIDRATPILAQDAATGKTYGEAVITVRTPLKGELKPLITYTLKDVRVVDDHQAFSHNSARGGETVAELVTLSYAKIEWAVGQTKAGFDWEKATKT